MTTEALREDNELLHQQCEKYQTVISRLRIQLAAKQRRSEQWEACAKRFKNACSEEEYAIAEKEFDLLKEEEK